MTQINSVQSGVTFQPSDLTLNRSSAPAASFHASSIRSMAEDTSCSPVTGFLTSIKDGVVSTFSAVTGGIYNGFVAVWNTLFGWAYTIGGNAISGDVLAHIAKAKEFIQKPETKNSNKLAEFQKLVQNCVAGSQANDEQINGALKELFNALPEDLRNAIKGAIWNTRPEADRGFNGGDYAQMKIDENPRSDVVKNGLRKLVAEMPSAQLAARKREFDAAGATATAKLVALRGMMDIELKPAYDDLNDETLNNEIKAYKNKLPKETMDKFHEQVWIEFGRIAGQNSVEKFEENPRHDNVKRALTVPSAVFAKNEAVLKDANANEKDKARAFVNIVEAKVSSLENVTWQAIDARIIADFALLPESVRNGISAIAFGPAGGTVVYAEGRFSNFEDGLNQAPRMIRGPAAHWIAIN